MAIRKRRVMRMEENTLLMHLLSKMQLETTIFPFTILANISAHMKNFLAIQSVLLQDAEVIQDLLVVLAIVYTMEPNTYLTMHE